MEERRAKLIAFERDRLIEAFKGDDIGKLDKALGDFIKRVGILAKQVNRDDVLVSFFGEKNLEAAYQENPEHFNSLMQKLEQKYTVDNPDENKAAWAKDIFKMAIGASLKKDPLDVVAEIYDELTNVSSADEAYIVIEAFQEELKDPVVREVLMESLESENRFAFAALGNADPGVPVEYDPSQVAMALSTEIVRNKGKVSYLETLQQQTPEVIKFLIEIGEPSVLDILKSPNFFNNKSSQAWKEVEILLAITGIDNEAIKDIVKNNINTANETGIIKKVVFNKVGEYVKELNKILRSHEGLNETRYYELQNKVAEKHPAVRFIFGLERENFREQGKDSQSFKAPLENKAAESNSPVRKSGSDTSSPPLPIFRK